MSSASSRVAYLVLPYKRKCDSATTTHPDDEVQTTYDNIVKACLVLTLLTRLSRAFLMRKRITGIKITTGGKFPQEPEALSDEHFLLEEFPIEVDLEKLPQRDKERDRLHHYKQKSRVISEVIIDS